MYRDFAAILLYVLVAIGFIFGSLAVVGRLLRRQRPYPEKESTYECGEETIGTAWVQFNIRFYVVALIFIVFAVEVVALFPWVTVLHDPGEMGAALLAMLVFVFLLVAGLVYDWVKGDLEWPKSLPTEGQTRRPPEP